VAAVIELLAKTYGETLLAMSQLKDALVSHDLDNIIRLPGWLDTLAKRAKELEYSRLSLCQEIADTHGEPRESVNLVWLEESAAATGHSEAAASIRASGALLRDLLPKIYETNQANGLLVQRQQGYVRFMMRAVQRETQYSKDGNVVAARVSRLYTQA
jgi:flagellar biosynthesis/type III secretory pathway chaperone